MPPFNSILRQIRSKFTEGAKAAPEVVKMSTLIEDCKGELIYYSLDDKFAFIEENQIIVWTPFRGFWPTTTTRML